MFATLKKLGTNLASFAFSPRNDRAEFAAGILDEFREVIRTSKFRISVERSLHEKINVTSLKSVFDSAHAEIAEQLGPWKKQFDICIRKELPIAPLTIAIPSSNSVAKTICIYFDVDSVRPSAIRHELAHVWQYQHDLSAPYWISHGVSMICELSRHEGWSAQKWRVLLSETPASRAEMLAKVKPFVDDAHFAGLRRGEAAGWAVVYYLWKYEGRALREIAALDEFPEPSRIIEELKKRDPRSGIYWVEPASD